MPSVADRTLQRPQIMFPQGVYEKDRTINTLATELVAWTNTPLTAI